MNDRQLSPHFKLSEFLRSARAEKLGIPMEPTLTQIHRGEFLAHLLEGVRTLCSNRRIHIHDGGGFRPRDLNEAIPGASRTSQHMAFEAADFHIENLPLLNAMMLIADSDLPYHQLIFERSATGAWIHISIAPPGAEPARRVLMHGPGITGYPEWDGRDLCA